MEAKTTPINEKKAHILAKTRDEDVGVFLVSMAGPHASDRSGNSTGSTKEGAYREQRTTA
jgi:hypothetical protein